MNLQYQDKSTRETLLVMGWGIVFELLFMLAYFFGHSVRAKSGIQRAYGGGEVWRRGREELMGVAVGRRAMLCPATGAGGERGREVCQCRWCAALRSIGR